MSPFEWRDETKKYESGLEFSFFFFLFLPVLSESVTEILLFSQSLDTDVDRDENLSEKKSGGKKYKSENLIQLTLGKREESTVRSCDCHAPRR